MHGLEDGQYYVPEFSNKVSVAPYGLNDEIFEMPREGIIMSQISSGFQEAKGVSAQPLYNSREQNSFPPTRSSPQIGNLGAVATSGATFLLIYFLRRLWDKVSKEKEPEIKPEINLTSKDIDKKLASIFDENIIFNEQKSTIKFNNFSPKLCQNMANFFRVEGLGSNISDDFSKGLTLKKLNLLTVDKFNEVFDKFLTEFKDNLDREKHEIAQKKQVEEDFRRQQEEIRGLQDLVNKAILDVGEIKLEEKGKSKRAMAIEGKEEENKARQKYEKEQKIISEKVKAMKNYAKDVKKFESILNQEQIYFFNKKFIEFNDLISNKISFEAVRTNEVKRSNQNSVEESQIEPKQEQIQEEQQNNQISEIPAPAPALIQDISMPDLIKLKALFLEEGYTKIYYPKEQIESVKFEELRLGFLHHEALDSNGFKNEYLSHKNQQNFPKSGGINRTDENLAKHYFHQLFDETVEKISQRFADKSELTDEKKQSIKDDLYSFLNYAMGDLDSVLKDYQMREVERKSRGFARGLGHAKGASLEDSEKLCICLKMFEDGGRLSTVNPEQLQEFTKFKVFAPKFQTENVYYTSKEIPIQEKSDEIFAQNLIFELNNQSNKLSGQERLENVVKDFFGSNAQKILEKLPENCGDYSQKISQVIVTTDCDGNIFQYLAKNPEIVKDIVDFANCKDLSVPSKDGLIVVKNHEEKSSLKDELKLVCERLKSEIGEIELLRGRAL